MLARHINLEIRSHPKEFKRLSQPSGRRKGMGKVKKSMVALNTGRENERHTVGDDAAEIVHFGGRLSFDVAHTFEILARGPEYESGAFNLLSKNATRLSRPPSRLDAALLCFKPPIVS